MTHTVINATFDPAGPKGCVALPASTRPEIDHGHFTDGAGWEPDNPALLPSLVFD